MKRERNQARHVIRINEANIRESHFYLTGFSDFFPIDSLGASSKRNGLGKPMRIEVEGLANPVFTDIPRDAKTGKPRRFFRSRAWVREFFARQKIKPGDQIAIERVNAYEYRIYGIKDVAKVEKRYTTSEFFAGIGLVRLALERQGFRVVFANDIEPDKFAMYRDNFAVDEFRLGDIHHLKAQEIPDSDLFTASFPCNDLSIAGAMGGLNKGQSSAFWGFVRVLKEMKERRPSHVLLENVPGFLMSHGGKDFESALLALNDLGYSCDALFLNARHFVPQSRLRLFVIGRQAFPGPYPFGLETSPCRPQCLVDFIASHPNVKWNIRELPPPPERRMKLEEIFEDIPPDNPAWWNEERAAYFMNQLSDRHLGIARKMMDKSSYSYGTAFRRVRKGRSMAELRVDGLAGCLRTPRGGSGRQILFKAGKGKYSVRLLTPRECARLQGVPDDYVINVPFNQGLFGFGDAVCVPAIEWIAANYLIPSLHQLTRVRGGVLQTG
ncbi:MAG: DNA (cytosine-5-)-methyltransferase [Phycisphaerae bacterium]